MKIALFVFFLVIHNIYAFEDDRDILDVLEERILENINDLRKLRVQVSKDVRTDSALIEDAALHQAKSMKETTIHTIESLVHKHPISLSYGCDGQAAGDLLGLVSTQIPKLLECTQQGVHSPDRYLESIDQTVWKLEDVLIAVKDIRHICPRPHSTECIERQIKKNTVAFTKLDEVASTLKHNEYTVRQAAANLQDHCMHNVIVDLNNKANKIIRETEWCISNVHW